MNMRRKANPIHDVVGIFASKQRQASALGLKLVQQKGCTQPATCLKTKQIFVEPLNPYWPEKRMQKWGGEVTHEVWHHAPQVNDTFPLFEEKGLTFATLWGKVYNIIDDVRNDANSAAHFKGAAQDVSKVHGFYCLAGADALASKPCPEGEMEVFRDILGLSYEQRSTWEPDVALVCEEYNKHTNANKYYHFLPRFDELVTATDVYDLVNDLLDAHDKSDAQTAEQECKDKAKEQEAEKGKGKKGKAKKGDAEGKEKGKEGKDKVEMTEEETVKYEDLLGHDHDHEDNEDIDHNEQSFLKIEYGHRTSSQYDAWPESGVREIIARDEDKYVDRYGSCSRGDMDRLYNEGRKLAATARRLFQAQIQDQIIHNNKSGRLDKRDLYRIPNGADDVFTRKKDLPSPKGTAVMLLTDHSGSMGGDKYNTVAAAAALLNDAVLPLQMPMFIAGFTERRKSLDSIIIKRFDEKRSSDEILQDYDNSGKYMYQNADGDSIMWAYRLLQQRKEKRKILIVLSDGSPAGTRKGDCWQYTKDVIAHVHKNVECYGIGIMDNNVKGLYPEYSVLKRADELEACLLNVIKTKLF